MVVIQQQSSQDDDLAMAGSRPPSPTEEDTKPLMENDSSNNTNNNSSTAINAANNTQEEATILAARERHDIFNVVALVRVLGSNPFDKGNQRQQEIPRFAMISLTRALPFLCFSHVKKVGGDFRHVDKLGLSTVVARSKPSLYRPLFLPQLGRTSINLIVCRPLVGERVCSIETDGTMRDTSNVNNFLAQTTECYFLIDLIWVALVPTCVKSPDVIIKVCVAAACDSFHLQNGML
jgi:hypothetical protein